MSVFIDRVRAICRKFEPKKCRGCPIQVPCDALGKDHAPLIPQSRIDALNAAAHKVSRD